MNGTLKIYNWEEELAINLRLKIKLLNFMSAKQNSSVVSATVA
jgi:hypothetical protein